MIEFACPSCNRMLRAKDEHAGRQVKCSGCGVVAGVPMAAIGELIDFSERTEPAAVSPPKPSALKPNPDPPPPPRPEPEPIYVQPRTPGRIEEIEWLLLRLLIYTLAFGFVGGGLDSKINASVCAVGFAVCIAGLAASNRRPER